MKFPRLREYSFGQKVEKYLQEEMVLNLRELVIGLSRLTFSENFNSFVVTVTIPANTDNFAIRNQIPGEIPTMRIIVRGDLYSKDITDGSSAWTQDFLYLRNTNATNATTAKVIFFK